jgi:S-adenosylmethionine uptake transporter
MNENQRGAFLMIASMVSFTCNDVFVKLIGEAMSLGQLLTIRGTMASVLILVLALALGGLRLTISGRNWRLIFLRSLTEIGAAYFFLTALRHMPIANVTAVLQALPLAVSVGAWLVFGHRFGWRRFLAILIGFVGVLLIVRPGTDGFSVWSLYALMAVVCVTARDLVTRLFTDDLPSLTVTLFTSVTVTAVFALVSLTQEWSHVEPRTWSYLIGSTIFIVGGYYFSVQVMRVGEISFVAPFRYTSLLSALILGLVVFGEWPDGMTLLGGAIVVATGLFALSREHRAKEH